MSWDGYKTMPIIADMIVFGYNKNKESILEPSEPCLCPECKKGILKIRAHVRRHYRKEDSGEKIWQEISLGQCDRDECGRMCRILPPYMVPHKHYEEPVISKVLDGTITEETPIGFPSIQTMCYWIAWLNKNLSRMESLLRSIGYQVLGYGEELLFSTETLVEQLRRDTNQWLKIIIRAIYNSGYRLLPL